MAVENERTVMAMDEYISKESAISIFRAKAEMAVCTPAQTYFDRAAKMLELLPAADVAPVRHWRWIGVDSSYWRWTHDGGHTVEHITFRCPECARKSIIKTNYCPNCGAKMDLEV